MENLNHLQRELTKLIHLKEKRIKTILADHDEKWRYQFADLIKVESDIELIHIATTKDEVIRASEQLEVDVIVMDVALSPSERDGLDASIEILQRKALPIILLTSKVDPEVAIEAITVGAINFISKMHTHDIISSIREAHRKQASLHPDVAETIRNEFIRLKRQEMRDKLTPTEKQVLYLIGLGHSQPKLIQLMGIAPNTMKTHIHHITHKLGTKTAKEAAKKAKRQGF
jgi:DNA-binding NarL/FixJ family response regulator